MKKYKKYYDANKFKLILMDEIFSSTTPEQACVNALEYLDIFIKDDRSICILTSHIKEHLRFCKDSKNRIKEHFVSVENKKEDEKEFILSFKIIDNFDKDLNWWFKKGEKFEKMRFNYAIWKEKIEEERLLNSKNS